MCSMIVMIVIMTLIRIMITIVILTMKMMIMNTNTFKSMQISRLALLSKSWVAGDQTGLPELILFTAI